MNKISKKQLLLVLIILLALFFLFNKINTNIYIGNYSYYPYVMDIEVKIDGKLIFNDSNLCSSPYFPDIVEEKLRYGSHTISVSSNKTNVYQETKVFLLPNQYIYIEFLAADTLYDYSILVENKNTLSTDSLFQKIDKMKTVINPKSRFRIESLFNPFYTE